MSRKKRGSLRVGTSGYQYDHWKGIFYPPDLPKKRWFSHYMSEFDTVEINNTFYQLPKAETFDGWREQAPKGFCFALKFSRYGSHIKRLKDPSGSIGMFVERIDALGKMRGPILVQLPPKWHVDVDRLDAFLGAAPRKLRWALEFRDTSWLCDEVYDVLRAHGAALCIHDMIEDHPREITADFTYLRFHGDAYGGNYTPQALTAAARRIKKYLGDGIDVYAYFNNDLEGHAVDNAVALRRYVSDG